MHRGHAEVDNVCHNVDVNLALFKDSADMGWVTTNCFRQEGSASGFFPVITLPQVCHIENTGGYLRLLAMSIPEAQELIDEGVILHTRFVGRRTLLHTSRGQAGLPHGNGCRSMPRTWGGIIQEGGRHRQRKVQTAVNFQAQFCPTADGGVPWGEQMD
jgi:hypothetical protein